MPVFHSNSMPANGDSCDGDGASKNVCLQTCESLEGLAASLVETFDSILPTHAKTLESCRAQLQNIHDELLHDLEADQDVNVPTAITLEQAVTKLRKALTEGLSKAHRSIHSSVSKCGREIDKNFVGDPISALASRPIHYERESTLRSHLNRLVLRHLLTSGLLDIADSLAQDDPSVGLESQSRAQFEEIGAILASVRNRDLSPALQWVEAHREELVKHESDLEYRLHRAAFVTMLSADDAATKQSDILAYASKFAPFMQSHSHEIQKLIGSLVFLQRGIKDSPYASLVTQDATLQYTELAEHFARDACALLGLPRRSALSIIFSAGALALPQLLATREKLTQRQIAPAVWAETSDELPPVEVDLGMDYRFHSTFSCPILRQHTTNTNPPMRLLCGHVISRDAMHRLTNGNYRLKCPYCPQESNVAEARQVYF